MQKKGDEDSGLPGVCHRLFSWLLSRLVGFWRLASGRPVPPPVSTEVPVEYTNGGPDHHKIVNNQDKDLDNSISNRNNSGDQLQGRAGRRKSGGAAGKVRVPIEGGGGGGKQERPWPRLSLVTNINEKSDDFIRERKEAMRRTNTMDPKKS